MTNHTPLSGRAQAVLDAVCDNTEPDCDIQHLIAAALRAAAEQSCFADVRIGLTSEVITSEVVLVNHILAIADELEGQDQLAKQSD